MKNLCIFCPIVWRLDQFSGTVRPCNWSSPDMVPLSRPPVFVPNSTLVTCLLEEFWAGRWQSPPKAVLNLNLSDLLLRKPEIYIAERKTSQKNVEPRCKSDSGCTKTFPTWKYWNTEILGSQEVGEGEELCPFHWWKTPTFGLKVVVWNIWTPWTRCKSIKRVP